MSLIFANTLKRILFLFDTTILSNYHHSEANIQKKIKVDWLRSIPFVLLHLGCGLVFITGFSTFSVILCVLLYFIRMFSITAFYHRYFSHRAYKTSRFMQTVFAILANTACQRGPLWWSACHRLHHRYADSPKDPHSPKFYPFWWSHLGWFLSSEYGTTRLENVKDWQKFPELRFLDRFDTLVPFLYIIGLYALGETLNHFSWVENTNGLQCVVWGFFISTVVLFHVTASINSFAHSDIGTRPHDTKDNSRNHWLLALLTLGEGWHNNHHFFPTSSKQGFFWWQIDITYYGIKFLEKLGLVWDLRIFPKKNKEFL
jgi:stearoyl-CoA desaturase (delta-9 desaturase)